MTFRRRTRFTNHNEGFWKFEKPAIRNHIMDISFPISQNVSEPLHIAGVKESPNMESLPEAIWKPFLPGVKSIKFGNLDVTEVTYGYFIKARYGAEGAKHWDPVREKYFGRNLTTEGFIIELDDSIFQKAQEIAEEKGYDNFVLDAESGSTDNRIHLRQVIIHTLKHALLAPLPLLIGLEPSKLSGSYDYIESNEASQNNGARNIVYIYDSETGGTGAIETVKNDESLLLRWLDNARLLIKNCPSGSCKRGYCRRCIYVENCGEINLNLNRFLCAPIFFEEEDLDWVFE